MCLRFSTVDVVVPLTVMAVCVVEELNWNVALLFP